MGLAARVRTLIEDRLLTAPNPFFAPAWPGDEAAIERACGTIRDVGGIDAGALASRALCGEICAQLDLAYAGRLSGVRTRTNPKTGIAQVLNPLQVHPAMVELATQPLLLGIIERYLRRRIYLADIDVRRVPPMTMNDLDQRAGTAKVGYTSSHWHRDIRGRQAKVMIYFTDVGEADSNFSFVPGSHHGKQLRPVNVDSSRLSEEQVAALGIAPVECFGPAGTTLVFDTNCVHRLRRKPTARVRDTVTFYYTPGQELRALEVDRAALERLPAAARAVFGGPRRAS
jgi:hypothetical protein